jgi:hypothetical protein
MESVSFEGLVLDLVSLDLVSLVLLGQHSLRVAITSYVLHRREQSQGQKSPGIFFF